MTAATTTDYGARSSARRAAKAAGLDPDKVHQLAGGRWALPAPAAPSAPASGDGIDIPDFLLVKNRRPLTPEQQEKLRAQLASVSALPERSDPRKPKGMSAEDWVALEAARAEKRKIKARNRIAKMLAKKNPKPVSLDRHPRADGRRRVCWRGEPMWQGTVLKEGPPPTVKWDNGNETEVEESWVEAIPSTLPPPTSRAPSAPHQPRPKRPPRPSVAEQLAGAIIRTVTKKNPYREGSAGHAVFSLYKDGVSVAEFEESAAGRTGTRRPADMLMYDVRKGHVRLEKSGGVDDAKK